MAMAMVRYASQILRRCARLQPLAMLCGRRRTPAPATDESEANAAATEQQLSSIRKLCERLGKQEPEHSDTLSFVGAKELIGQLTQEYRSRKAS